MNILVLTHFGKRSHSHRPVAYMVKRWAELGHTVTVCTPPTEYEVDFVECGIRVIRTQQKRKISPRTISIVRNELKSAKFDIVFATNSKTITTAALACIGIEVKLVVYRGTVSGLYRYDPTTYLTLLNPRVDAIACVSKAVEKRVCNQLLSKRVMTRTIYKGHRLDWYNKVKSADLTHFGIPRGAFTVVAVANFRRKKGLDILLRSTYSLGNFSNLHLIVVGPNSNNESADKLIEESPMRERIHRLGFRSDALEIVSACNVLVQPSIDGEGLPRAVVEAMALGTPPIATLTGGTREIVVDGQNGFLVDANDPRAIAERIRFCLSHGQCLGRMAANCANTVKQKLSADASAKEYLDMFADLAG